MLVTIILLVVIFTALVLVHEWGHFITARRAGVAVDEFGVGFPPRLVGRRHGGTLYSVNAIPLGGFVRLRGEDGEDTSPESFMTASKGTRTRILLAGVTMNLIAGFVLLTILCWLGLPALGGFAPGWLPKHYSQSPRLAITEVVANSPAQAIGLHSGDFVLKANGQTVTDESLLHFTKAHAGNTVSLSVVENGQVVTRRVKLRPPGTTSGYLGIATQSVSKIGYNWWQGPVAAAWITLKLFILTIWAIIGLIIHLPQLIGGLFTRGVPAAAGSAAGPVGIYFILQNLSRLGWPYIILFAANISVALAAFNVLPIPALDGGRLALIWIQELGGKRMKSQTEAIIHLVGFAAVIGLAIIITVYDVRRFL